MIGKLKGTIEEIGDDHVLVDVHGVCYVAHCSSRTLSRLGSPGEAVVLFIETYVREDTLKLFGFMSALDREGETLIRLIGEGAEMPREQWPSDKGRPTPLNAQQEAMVDLLSAALRLIADQHQLSPMAIATRKELEKFLRGEPDCILLEGWRHSLAGEALAAVMRGERGLELHHGVLRLSPAG